MDYIIGVDGGGTKTEAAAYNLDGIELMRVVTGAGNLVAGRNEAIRNIIEAIEQCLNKLPSGRLEGIYLGIAGAEAGDNAEVLKKTLKNRLNTEIIVMNDGELALRAMLKGKDGILTVAGTGSISFGINGERKERCGGYGHILGDEGSAYKIAIEAFKKITYETDCGMEYSNLSIELFKELGADNIDDVLGFVYSFNKNELASYARLVSKLAERGDSNAVAIIEEQAVKLAETTLRVYENLQFGEKCCLAIKGSVILNSSVLRRKFEECIRSKINNIDIVDDNISATKGAYYLHLRQLTIFN